VVRLNDTLRPLISWVFKIVSDERKERIEIGMSEEPRKVGYKSPPKGRPFVKGQSGHPGGRESLPAELVAARKVTKQTFEEKLQEFMRITMGELQGIMQNPATANLDLLVGSIVTKAIVDGCTARMTFLLDRMGVAKALNDADNTINVTPDMQDQNLPFYVVAVNDNGKFVRARPRELAQEEKPVFDDTKIANG